jgi:aspartyl-tRNA(Asn)/glutamyl-tRNA(Gln) amidotransferase subunit A
MPEFDAAYPTIEDLQRLLTQRALSVTDTIQASLQRIAELAPLLNAVINVSHSALDEARSADERIQRGGELRPLEGVPLILKDNIDTAGLLTTLGSELFRQRIPDSDARCAAALRDAGAIVVAKANMNEFASGGDGANEAFGRVRNPWATDRSSGGSSSGCGAALAVGACVIAVGSDTRGSGRIPAAACGVVGYRPSYGLISREGVAPRALTLDTLSPMARTARDVASVAAALVGPADLADLVEWTSDDDSGPTAERLVAGTVVGVPSEDGLSQCSSAVVENFAHAVDTFRELGAKVVDWSLPRVDAAKLARLLEAEFAKYYGLDSTELDRVGSTVRAEFERGSRVSTSEYVSLLEYRNSVERDARRLSESFDAWLTPTLSGTAMAMTGEGAGARFIGPFTQWPTAAHLPAISVPSGFDSEGLPTAVQIVAPAGRDSTCLRLAGAFQMVTGHHLERPSPAA